MADILRHGLVQLPGDLFVVHLCPIHRGTAKRRVPQGVLGDPLQQTAQAGFPLRRSRHTGIVGLPVHGPQHHVPAGAALEGGLPVRGGHGKEPSSAFDVAPLVSPGLRRGRLPLVADGEQVLPPRHVPGGLRGDGEADACGIFLFHIQGESQVLRDLSVRRHGGGRQLLAGEGLCLFRDFLRQLLPGSAAAGQQRQQHPAEKKSLHVPHLAFQVLVFVLRSLYFMPRIP